MLIVTLFKSSSFLSTFIQISICETDEATIKILLITSLTNSLCINEDGNCGWGAIMGTTELVFAFSSANKGYTI